MAWDMTPVEAPPSAVKLSLEQIPDDVVNGVEEAFDYSQAHPTERLVITFDSEDDRDLVRAAIRSYCEVRPKGRLTASIWAVDSGGMPALSLFFSPYVKREKIKVTTNAGQPST